MEPLPFAPGVDKPAPFSRAFESRVSRVFRLAGSTLAMCKRVSGLSPRLSLYLPKQDFQSQRQPSRLIERVRAADPSVTPAQRSSWIRPNAER
jgi:hypothetical protein